MTEDIQTIRIGGLFSITGNWSSLGRNSSAAMRLAIEDINTYMEERGSRYRFSTVEYDTKLDASTAKEAMMTGFSKNGIRIFIGPQSSAELTAVKEFADNNSILVISQGSTASSLAISNDAVFRYCPGDAVEGAAVANTMYSSGKRVVISLARNDAGNIGLQLSLGARFSELGGQVQAIAPYSIELTNFAPLLAELKSKILQYSAVYGADKVAVYLASFDECTGIFREASADSVFSSVRWYGGDGVVKSELLISDVVARDFSIATEFFAPEFGLPLQHHPDLAAISSKIIANTGIEPDAYALSVYDAMSVIARSIANYPDALNDFSKLKKIFSDESRQHYGISGPTLLDENGDRNIGSFDYWGIVKEGSNYKWKIVGKSN
jgi:branched-chain amino acid transport system substrate-binding protein